MRKWSGAIAEEKKQDYFSGVITEQSIKDILSATDLPVLIGEYVALKTSSGSMTGSCPFHNEKTPSFKVFRDHYRCFGCGANGNAIDFLMNHLGMTFPASAALLAMRAGIVLEETSGPKKKKNSTEDRLLDTLRRACATYQQHLFQPTGVAALEYLRSRNIDEDSIARFGIGFAPDSWTTLSSNKDFKQADLIKTGLACSRTNGPGCYDFFRARTVFPVHSASGSVVGFGGRLLAGTGPKYLNTGETPLYHKGEVLFGINQARNAIRKAGYVVVVEGFFDVVIPAQYGFENIVSTCGTALTLEQIALLFSLSNKVVFCFDGDAAGSKATWRAAEMMLEKLTDQQEVRLCQLPTTHDPDSLVVSEGVDRFKEMIEGAPTLCEYLAQTLAKGANLPESRARALLKAKAICAKFASPLLATLFRKHICDVLSLSADDFQQLGEAPKLHADPSLIPCPCCKSRPFNEESLGRWRIRCACGILTKPCNDAETARAIWNRRDNNTTPSITQTTKAHDLAA